MLRNTKTSWGSLARAFHWVLGVLIIGMLAYGYWMNHFAARPDRFFHRSIHADIGYVVLVLMVARLIWRGFNPTPALPADTPIWQRWMSYIVNWGMYGLTILVAMLGWAHSGAHKPNYSDWFGLFHVPQFTSENRADSQFYENWHIYMAYALAGFIAFHILAAIYHVLAKDDRVVARMIDGEPG